MKTLEKFLFIVLIMLPCVGCDQITKIIARQSIANSTPISFVGNMFRLQYTENPGAFLSIGAGASENMRLWIFTVLVGLFLIGLFVYIMTSPNISKAQICSLSLVAGGGISNLIDRILNEGRVVDFMNMGIGSLRTGIFNIADIAITFGVIWLIVISIADKRQRT